MKAIVEGFADVCRRRLKGVKDNAGKSKVMVLNEEEDWSVGFM